jgi:hypothetical protein
MRMREELHKGSWGAAIMIVIALFGFRFLFKLFF